MIDATNDTLGRMLQLLRHVQTDPSARTSVEAEVRAIRDREDAAGDVELATAARFLLTVAARSDGPEAARSALADFTAWSEGPGRPLAAAFALALSANRQMGGAGGHASLDRLARAQALAHRATPRDPRLLGRLWNAVAIAHHEQGLQGLAEECFQRAQNLGAWADDEHVQLLVNRLQSVCEDMVDHAVAGDTAMALELAERGRELLTGPPADLAPSLAATLDMMDACFRLVLGEIDHTEVVELLDLRVIDPTNAANTTRTVCTVLAASVAHGAGDLEAAGALLTRTHDLEENHLSRAGFAARSWVAARVAATRIGAAADPLVDHAEHALQQALDAKQTIIGGVRLQTAHELLRAENDALAVRSLELERQSLTDGLTGLGNRRALDLRLAKQHQAPHGAVMVIDLDEFKGINDTWGHEVGDAALRRVAGVIARVIRAEDGAYRYGGDEFVVVLDGSALDAARRCSRAILEGVRDVPWQEIAEGLAVTCSIGVATTRGSTGSDLHDADKALLRAKELGRDVAVLAPSETVGARVQVDAG